MLPVPPAQIAELSLKMADVGDGFTVTVAEEPPTPTQLVASEKEVTV
jgi:hypothetical protein